MKYYIPRRVVLPFGYTVRIKQLRRKAWKKAYNDFFKDKDSDGCLAFAAFPSEKSSLICLQRNRTAHERKEDLVHELQHVMVEYGEYVKTVDT